MSRVLRSVALIGAGAAVGAGVVSIFTGSGDERTDLLRDLAARQAAQVSDLDVSAAGESTQAMAMSQFYRLHEFRRLGEEGQVVAWVVPVPEGRESDPVAEAAAGASVRLPRIALDPAARNTWATEVSRLSGFERSIDARIFEAFAAVRSFIEEHPWPDSPGLAGVRASEWSSPDVTERWLSLNRALVSRVDALLAGL